MSAQAQLRGLLQDLVRLADTARAEQVAALADRLATDRLRVVLVGESKRGKSTLANALLGRPVLPCGVVPVTALTTTVRRGRPERLEVTLRTGEPLTLPVTQLVEMVTEQRNPGNRMGVAKVTVLLSGEPGPEDRWLSEGVELIDTPGTGSVNADNTAEADAALTSMDAAVLVLSTDPPVSASEISLLRRVRELSVRTLVVVNKADHLDERGRAEVLAFTRRALAEGVGAPPPVLMCSALTGLRARQTHDSSLWEASGMSALVTELVERVTACGDRHLLTSLALSTRRLLRQMLDETGVSLRASELRAAQREAEVESFHVVVRRLGRLRVEGLAVVSTDLRQLRRDLDASAAAGQGPLAAASLQRLDLLLGGQPRLPAAALEDAGQAALADVIRPGVDRWRRERAALIDEGLRAAAARQRELLDAAVAAVRDAARSHLGIDLYADPPEVDLPDPGRFFYSLGAEIGWSLPAASALRRHLPGDLGRRRVDTRLRAEANRLVELHLGRARADFQVRLDDAARTLTRTLDRSYRELQDRLSHALGGLRPFDDPVDQDRAETADQIRLRSARLAELVVQVDALLAGTGG